MIKINETIINTNLTKGLEKTFKAELEGILRIPEIIDNNFHKIIDEIIKIKGKVIVIGMGKSGLVGKKIAATLSSTGTSSFFVHPGEAIHGDLGMISENDIVLMISNSGNTQEIVDIIPVIKRYFGVKIIGITSNKNSILAKESDFKLIYKLDDEGYLNLPPFASTTVQMVIGDLIATALMEKKGFKKENFALFHPGGSLGKKLLLKLENIFEKVGSKKEKISLKPENTLEEAIFKITEGGKGGVVIIDDNNKVLGVFTDGDLRRFIKDNGTELLNKTKIKNIMTKNPKIANINQKAVDILNLMETNNITFLPIVDNNFKLIGAINIHDLLKEGIK